MTAGEMKEPFPFDLGVAILRIAIMQVHFFISVVKSGNNIKIVRDLLADFRESLKCYKYQHIGSDRLWQNHANRLQEMDKAMQTLSVNAVSLLTV